VQVKIEKDLSVQADPSLLQIVYENLLSNAIKYGRKGGTVKLSGEQCNDKVELHVWNDGPGIPSHQMDKLFKKFSRLQPPLGSEQETGTGLGLFITREILRRHGGQIHAESVSDEWIDFVFTLSVPETALDPN